MQKIIDIFQPKRPSFSSKIWLGMIVLIFGIAFVLFYNQTNLDIKKRRLQFLENKSKTENLTTDEQTEFCDLIWQVHKIWITDCENVDLEWIRECVSGKYELDERAVRKMLDVSEEEYHFYKNKILGKYAYFLKKKKIDNPDLGYSKKYHILIFKDVVSQKIIILTNEKITDYGK